MRMLIIGGTGFIGPSVVRSWVEEGHLVAVLHRGGTRAELPDGVRVIRGERDRLRDARDAIAEFGPDAAVHMILGTAQDAWTAREALDGLVERCVVVSSIDVYRAYGRLLGIEAPIGADTTHDSRLTPESPLRTCLYPYRDPSVLPHIDRDALPPDRRRRLEDYDKILVESVMLGSPTLECAVLRLPMVFGPRDAQHRLWSTLKRMDDGRPAILASPEMLTWRTARGFVDDVALAIARLATADPFPTGERFHVCDPTAFTQRAWIERLAAIVGWSGEIVEVPSEQLPEHLASDHDYRHHLACDPSALTTRLDLPPPTDLDLALSRTVEWERAHPPAPGASLPDTFDYAAEDVVLAGLA